MSDKFMRIGHLLEREAAVAGESIDDTILDLINYLVLLRATLREKHAPANVP